MSWSRKLEGKQIIIDNKITVAAVTSKVPFIRNRPQGRMIREYEFVRH
jgi:hypothetical protein